jgi:bifunctional ADP-heptose synthase (sugar kinase/adenylyltransferase)
MSHLLPVCNVHVKGCRQWFLQTLPCYTVAVQFSNGRLAPEGARIVYIDGAFDVFHPGHVKILKVHSLTGMSARCCGAGLIVLTAG